MGMTPLTSLADGDDVTHVAHYKRNVYGIGFYRFSFSPCTKSHTHTNTHIHHARSASRKPEDVEEDIAVPRCACVAPMQAAP